MQEVRAAAMVLFSSSNNNKRMFETIIPTKQSQHEWYILWRWQETCSCRV
jgi:hypothetical protein